MSAFEITLPHASISEDRDTRYLHLGDTPWVQGAMLRRKPHALALQYIQRMMAWLLWANLDALNELPIVQLGLGSASLTKYSALVLGCPTTAVELNPHVIHACHRWFQLPQTHPAINIIEDDALHWLNALHAHDIKESVYAMQVDMYDQEAAAPILDDVNLYAKAKEALRADGMFLINLFGRDARFAESVQRLRQVFGQGNVMQFKPTKEGNTVVIAHKGAVQPLNETEWQNRCHHIDQYIDTTGSLKSHKWRKVLQMA